ncbi:MAG: hypothetical protein C0501_14275 [Isosphaera sp.]|nr:hypothetical protein [Isosphaera sp.]
MATATLRPGEYARQLLFVTTPALWPAWPFLPLVRRTPGGTELGMLFDARGAVDRTGYSATVFLTCLFVLPDTVEQLLALPREVYDTAEELVGAGWRVD